MNQAALFWPQIPVSVMIQSLLLVPIDRLDEYPAQMRTGCFNIYIAPWQWLDLRIILFHSGLSKLNNYYHET